MALSREAAISRTTSEKAGSSFADGRSCELDFDGKIICRLLHDSQLRLRVLALLPLCAPIVILDDATSEILRFGV
jgi:hypothetical protein